MIELSNPGTGLSKWGVLALPDIGRGSHGKSVLANGLAAQRSEASKKKTLSPANHAALVLEAFPL
jgi:hypothetical protein